MRRPAPTGAEAASVPDALLEPYAVRALMMRAADWQLAHPPAAKRPSWTQGIFYAGMMALAEIASDPRYLSAARAAGERNAWQPGSMTAYADDLAITQTYLLLYLRERDRRAVAPTLALFDDLVRRPFSEPLAWQGNIKEREWAWCDALFMTPPALALATTATGDRKYLDLMNRLWWKTTDYLYDRAESLYFRDSRAFDAREKNGSKVFWSRGNGWVMAGLARVLSHLPDDHPDRPRYVALFGQIAQKVARLQRADGLWRSSLLDPDSFPSPESSGTALHTYALAWGVNRGLLDRALFEPVVRRAWVALRGAVGSDGRLGYVQPIGDRPASVSRDSTAELGVGTLLLAGSEVFRLSLLERSRSVVVSAQNPLAEARFHETLEVPWAGLAAALGAAPADALVVLDQRSGALVPWQIFDRDVDGAAETLLVSASFSGGETRRFAVHRPVKPFRAPPDDVRAHGRFTSERQDGMAWENDRGVFFVGGSGGIDVWAKGVRSSVLGARPVPLRAPGPALDVYEVGPSRGCGGLGLWHEDKLHVPGGAKHWRLAAQGPVRVAFELVHDVWGPEGTRVEETKRVSLDLGHNLSRIESRFRIEGSPRRLPVAIGIVRRERSGHVARSVPPTWLSYWEPPRAATGEMACGVVVAGEDARFVQVPEHFLLVADRPSDRPFVYHTGGCWSRGLDFHSAAEWALYLAAFARGLEAPVVVSVP